MLTPRIIRVLDLDVDDLRPFRVGRDSSGGVYELPLPAQQPQPPAPPPQDDDAGGGIFRPGSTPTGTPARSAADQPADHASAGDAAHDTADHASAAVT